MELQKKDILGTSNDLPNKKGYDKFLKNVVKLNLPKQEEIQVKGSNGREVSMTLSREGFTDKGLAIVFSDPNSTEDQKASYIANYLFQRGKENASFLAELYLSKGKLARENQAFRADLRFDFEMFTDFFINLLISANNNIEAHATFDEDGLRQLGKLFKERAETLRTRYQARVDDRLRAKGFGIYIDRLGKPYDTRTKEIIDVVKKDVETTQDELKKKDVK